jgi:FkbM family methyltransferase
MKEFEFEYDDFIFRLAMPPYWDTIYAGKPKEKLYPDYCKMLEAVKKTSKEKYVLDIGANHGLFGVPAAKLGYKVFGFEPVAGNIESLQRAKEINNLQDFDMFHYALSNQNGEIEIYVPVCPDNASLSQAAAISNMGNKSFTVEKVGTIRFDDWILNQTDYLDVGFIKMDVQGSEYIILEGMSDYLSVTNDIYLVCEYEHHLNNMGHTFEELDRLIKSYGFLYIEHISANDKLFYKP